MSYANLLAFVLPNDMRHQPVRQNRLFVSWVNSWCNRQDICILLLTFYELLWLVQLLKVVDMVKEQLAERYWVSTGWKIHETSFARSKEIQRRYTIKWRTDKAYRKLAMDDVPEKSMDSTTPQRTINVVRTTSRRSRRLWYVPTNYERCW